MNMSTPLFTLPPHRGAALLVAALLWIGLTGCAGNKGLIELDYHFSMNVAKTPLGFPNPKTPLTPAQSEVLARLGPPDYVRFWWRPDGSFITTSDLSGKDGEKIRAEMTEADKSWIYIGEDKEVLFYKKGGYKKQPLDEVVKAVCQFGDPSTKTPPIFVEGRRHETWLWYDHGMKIELIEGKEVSRSYFTPTGVGTYIGK